MADQMGINSIYAGQSPEQKVAIVRGQTAKSKTIYLGDGINDAPALLTATVGIAFGLNSDITCEAAGAVIMESSMVKVDELFHIARRMRLIALQSALGGMLLSVAGDVYGGRWFSDSGGRCHCSRDHRPVGCIKCAAGLLYGKETE